ncbi:MAG: recombinase family protein [Clostridia bacterium]|nr:recombinase family protein [Clostridia bacterium]
MEYGVGRISTRKQNIERQVRNILAKYPNARIIRETYTGTKLEGRKEFENLLKIIKKGDTLIFDSVSRMSRNSEEGCNLYEDLFNKGINLIFLKEGYINTEVYRKALDNQINIVLNTGNKATDELMQTIISALNKYTLALAKEQIKKAFDQAEKEVKDLHTRTSEGILTARLDGKQIGLTKGTKLTTKKEKETKPLIIKYSKDFDGTLSDIECIKLIGISRNSYYLYKRELKEMVA